MGSHVKQFELQRSIAISMCQKGSISGLCVVGFLLIGVGLFGIGLAAGFFLIPWQDLQSSGPTSCLSSCEPPKTKLETGCYWSETYKLELMDVYISEMKRFT